MQNKAEHEAQAFDIFIKSAAASPYLDGKTSNTLRWVDEDDFMLVRDGVDWALIEVKPAGSVYVYPGDINMFG